MIRSNKNKWISIMLCASMAAASFGGLQMGVSAAEEVKAAVAPQEMVAPLAFHYNQAAGQAITLKKQAEAAAAEAARVAAEQALKAAQEEAAKKVAAASAKKSAQKATTPVISAVKNYSSAGSIGQQAVSAAKSCIGMAYGSMNQGTAMDCSGLVAWSYAQVGIQLPHSSSGQAQMLNSNGKGISRAELKPGDLVFWQYAWGSGFMHIGHVGIYAGNNQVIDASPNGVVQRSLYDQNKMVFFARPY